MIHLHLHWQAFSICKACAKHTCYEIRQQLGKKLSVIHAGARCFKDLHICRCYACDTMRADLMISSFKF